MFIFGIRCMLIFMFNFAFASLLFFILIFGPLLLRTSFNRSRRLPLTF
jgi:hypothetical protein